MNKKEHEDNIRAMLMMTEHLIVDLKDEGKIELAKAADKVFDELEDLLYFISKG